MASKCLLCLVMTFTVLGVIAFTVSAIFWLVFGLQALHFCDYKDASGCPGAVTHIMFWAASLILAVVCFWGCWKAKLRCRSPASQATRTTRRVFTIETTDPPQPARCILCVEDPAVTVQPCGHTVVCIKCCDLLVNNNKRCPHCSDQIQTVLKSYTS